jgi:glutamate-1-semialdehyde 2,1-aminomutase
MNYSERLNKVIPAGCHTYSRGDDQFPSNAPQILEYGEGAYVYTPEGKKYIDYGMGLRAVTCGYAEKTINQAAARQIAGGNCLTRPSLVELQAAELACDILGFDMVKFTKNGSTATTAAVKLARAATGRSRIVYPANQPFFSYDDWFIKSTRRCRGIPFQDIQTFKSVESLSPWICSDQIACIIMEPKDHDLKAIRALCDKHGIILIFDEMITGFRYHGWSKAAHDGVKPDLSCFGKGMANGFSVACVGGKREIMSLGARRDMFLASTTHGAEMCGLAAFIATVRFYQKHNVSQHLKDYLAELEKILPPCLGGNRTDIILSRAADANATWMDVEKTLFMQEMCKRGILMPYVSPSYRHGEKELKLTKEAIECSMEAINKGAVLEGPRIVPVFQ